MGLNSDDMIDEMLNMSTHDDLLLFSNFGKVYRIKGYKVPASSRTAKGTPIVNLLNLDKDEKIKAMVDIVNDGSLDKKFLFFVTKRGIVKRVSLKEFQLIRQSGKIAISLNENDELFAVLVTDGNEDIIIGSSLGKAVRFNETDVRPTGRTSKGMRGFNVDSGEVIGIASSNSGKYILTMSENGYGKKTLVEDFRKTNRGVKGVASIKLTEKTGKQIVLKAVNGDEDALLMNDDGMMIRINLESVGVYGRQTMGVKMFNVSDSKVATVTIINKELIQYDKENIEQ